MTRTVVLAAWLTALAGGARAETLAELLDSRALETVVHPIAAQFLSAEGAELLGAEQRERASAQLKVALGRQTNPMTLLMRGSVGAMNTPAVQRMREQASAGRMAGRVLGATLGIGGGGGGGGAEQVNVEAMQREMQDAMTEPWVRGIGAARALAALGDAEAAARFYVACLEMLDADWVPSACLDDILRLGPRRAEVLLRWMLENAGAVSFGFDIDLAFADEDDDPNVDRGAAQLRSAALEGLGALVGSGRLSEEARERAFGDLSTYATRRDNEPYRLGIAEGLARSRDARAAELLEGLADRRNDPDVRQAALRGLAMGFDDDKAIAALRRDLGERDAELALRAAQALYETGDEQSFEWATDVITRRRTADTQGPDIRAQVVRDLVELGGEASERALRAALDDGTRNEWLEAWLTVALLELGDHSVAPQVEAALAVTSWELDPRGLRSIWRAIKPWLQYATNLALSGGASAVSSSQQLRDVTALIANAVTSERGRHLQRLGQRESLTAQLRWQAADAIATAQPEGGTRMLEQLLDDPTPGVQSSAALALARSADPAALPLIAAAYDRALGDGSSLGHKPELRATLVRAAVLQARTAPATAALLSKAASDADAGVRFIALAAGAAAAR